MKGCHHVAGFKGVTIVDIERHSAVAAVNLAGLGSNRINLSLRQNIVIFNIPKVKHTGIAVFKVKNDLGTLAKLNNRSCSNFSSNYRCSNITLGHFTVTGSKIQAINSTNSIIFQSELDVRCLIFYIVKTISSAHCQRNCFAERNGNFRAFEH